MRAVVERALREIGGVDPDALSDVEQLAAGGPRRKRRRTAPATSGDDTAAA